MPKFLGLLLVFLFTLLVPAVGTYRLIHAYCGAMASGGLPTVGIGKDSLRAGDIPDYKLLHEFGFDHPEYLSDNDSDSDHLEPGVVMSDPRLAGRTYMDW